MSVKANLANVKAQLPPQVQLIAVSKTHPAELILEAYNEGQRDFGENKVQEMVAKQAILPHDIRWHLIGHLQSNKIKYIASFVHLIHSIDSYKLLEAVNKEAIKNKRVIDCLLQIYIAKEESKFGFSENELDTMFTSMPWNELTNVRICGLMGMATFTDNQELIKQEFTNLTRIFEQLKLNYFTDKEYFKEISMGMSDDFLIAAEVGSTMVRVGSNIFGTRDYSK
jgi:pyridoxal phosphate enzyme (YggS family)